MGDTPPGSRGSEAKRRVLVALFRLFAGGSPYATPAPNQRIAEELFLSVDAVKTHMRALFDKFDVGDVPQNQKRAKLVERAFQSGAIGPKDLV